MRRFLMERVRLIRALLTAQALTYSPIVWPCRTYRQPEFSGPLGVVVISRPWSQMTRWSPFSSIIGDLVNTYPRSLSALLTFNPAAFTIRSVRTSASGRAVKRDTPGNPRT